MYNNNIICGVFLTTAEKKETIDNLVTAVNLLNLNEKKFHSFMKSNCDTLNVKVNENKSLKINFNTYLFFQNYNKYWETFKSLDLINKELLLHDFLHTNYLEFNHIENKKIFFIELLSVIQKQIFNENTNCINDNPNVVQDFLSSDVGKKIFEYTKNSLKIPLEYQLKVLKNISTEDIIQYNWGSFKKIFLSIDLEKKLEYFKKNSILGFFSPALKLAYSYDYCDNGLILNKSKQISAVRTNFENLFMGKLNLFSNMSLQEQKDFFKIAIIHSRKDIIEHMFNNYPKITKENYSQKEYEDIIFLSHKHNIDFDLSKRFLFKALSAKLEPKKKERKMKI